ncbi:RNA polymerase sigma factor SigM [Nocardioides sp. Y6]|uniref:RNA polymerase sigma factor SigM n=1 Tax=Nocardioides malaquae TaxID=2773426 RepID=A0ABR9RRN8_9ACTN|nr:RNA polymerase sigma factor SigM [Nocardioides malaquae]MBE7324233.1 RNA polymerase sigma factor SigM [Nocardioides malaquae]
MSGPGSPDPDTRTDAELLAAHVAGDPDAFATLVGRHRDRLWAVALRTAGNREDADDALQDALVSAFRRAASFRGQSSVTTWLHRIVVNACLDRIRHQKVRAAQPLPDDVDRMTPAATGAGGEAQDPAETVVRSEQRRRVVAALAALPPEHRAALVLVDMEGFSVAEAAKVLGCPTGTVKSRCARGRAKLRTLLLDAGVEPPRPPPPGNPAPPPDVRSPAAPTPPPAPEGGATP